MSNSEQEVSNKKQPNQLEMNNLSKTKRFFHKSEQSAAMQAPPLGAGALYKTLFLYYLIHSYAISTE